MARYSAGTRSGVPSTVAMPWGSIYAGANNGFRLIEFGFMKGPSTAATLLCRLERVSDQGTPGSSIAIAKFDPDSADPGCTVFDTHTAAPTTVEDYFRLGAMAGSSGGNGWCLVPPGGIWIPPGTGNGIIFKPMSGSQLVACDFYFVWEEDA